MARSPVFVSANFSYNMYVCGRTTRLGCGTHLIEEANVVTIDSHGKCFVIIFIIFLVI